MCQPEEPPNFCKPSDYQAKTGASFKLFELNSYITLEIHTKQIGFLHWILDSSLRPKNNTLFKKTKHFVYKKKRIYISQMGQNTVLQCHLLYDVLHVMREVKIQ